MYGKGNRIMYEIPNNILLCKDCKNYNRFKDIPYGLCYILKRTMKDTDFCSYAQKRVMLFCIDDHKYSGLIDE